MTQTDRKQKGLLDSNSQPTELNSNTALLKLNDYFINKNVPQEIMNTLFKYYQLLIDNKVPEKDTLRFTLIFANGYFGLALVPAGEKIKLEPIRTKRITALIDNTKILPSIIAAGLFVKSTWPDITKNKTSHHGMPHSIYFEF